MRSCIFAQKWKIKVTTSTYSTNKIELSYVTRDRISIQVKHFMKIMKSYHYFQGFNLDKEIKGCCIA